MVTFEISGTSDKFWNKNNFVSFLASNQKNDIILTTAPEAVCLRTLGVYELLDAFDFNSVTINTWNPLEHHSKYRIKFLGKNFWFDQAPAIDPVLHDWNESATFLCLYHRPTAARLALASYLQQHASVIHFSADLDVDKLDQFELDKLLTWHVDSVTRAAKFVPKLPLLQKPSNRLTAFHGYDYTDPLTNLYQSILIDVVVESHVAGNTFFPTEKTVRPILLKKPFLMFASANYLDYMHQMGFLTFNDFWSEDYDGYEQGNRLKRIYSVIDSIAQRSKQDLVAMYWDMKYVLDHNYNLLISKKFKTRITAL